jgi:NTP pyrophosphatase (non-canonical NTP hydrolase)
MITNMFEQPIHELIEFANDLDKQAEQELEFPLAKENIIQLAQTYRSAADFLKLAQFGGTQALINAVREWGTERNIIGPEAKATVATQFEKLKEEVFEVQTGIQNRDQHEIIDGIGDCTVVLILLSELIGVKFETCLMAAYDEIKNRKGAMVDGIYVKETNHNE